MRRFLIEAFAVLALAAFIFLMLSDRGTTGKTVPEIAGALEEEGLLTPDDRSSGLLLRRNFGLEEEDFEGVYYAGPAGFMDVEEVVIVKEKDAAKREAAAEAFAKRIASQEDIFASYGPEQMALLSKAQVWKKGDYAVLVIGHEAEDLMAAVRRQIER